MIEMWADIYDEDFVETAEELERNIASLLYHRADENFHRSAMRFFDGTTYKVTITAERIDS